MFGLLSKKGKATGALKEFYATPAPKKTTSLSDLPLLAVDMETTGLTAETDKILSIGWVPINGTTIDLSGAGYVLLSGANVGDSAVIHQLTDDMVATGIPENEAIEQFLLALRGRVMLNHFAALETSFLDAACLRHFNAPLEVPFVDTFALERRHMERMGTYPRGEDLRLARVRARYQLPTYRNHNALTDALACAELYLALVANSKASTLRCLK
jgi:hypothetical protein